MKLYDFVASVVLQGNIRLSLWRDDTEIVLSTWEDCEQLFTGELEEEWEDLEITYIFCASDGYLHIEVKEDDD